MFKKLLLLLITIINKKGELRMNRIDKNKFWLGNPKGLLNVYEFLPLEGMTFEAKLNAITRLIIFLGIVGYLLKIPNTLGIVLISLLIIILVYFASKEMTKNTENYTSIDNYRMKDNNKSFKSNNKRMYNNSVNRPSGYAPKAQYNPLRNNKKKDPLENTLKCLYKQDQQDLWCAPTVASNPSDAGCGEKWFSPNSAYYKSASKTNINPKLLQAPIIPTPIYANDSWRTNEFSNFSIINSKRPTDLAQSGYYIDGHIDPAKMGHVKIPPVKRYPQTDCTDPYDCTDSSPFSLPRENFTPSKDVYSTCCGGSGCSECDGNGGGINSVAVEHKFGVPIEVCASLPGDMIDDCSYDPKKSIYSNIPNNQPVGDYQQYPTLRCYNDNVRTQEIQPGVYSQTEVNEPQIWNLGISTAQQFPPVEVKHDKDGNKIYVQRDPRINCNSKNQPEPYVQTPNASNVYDPRFTGYGDSRRVYIDEMTGQPRFFYDDIDGAKQGNFIIRSNIDTLGFADQYGMLDEQNGIKNSLNSIRGNVDNAWMDRTNDFRDDLQERLMRKANEITRQRRLAPLRRDQGTCNRC